MLAFAVYQMMLTPDKGILLSLLIRGKPRCIAVAAIILSSISLRAIAEECKFHFKTLQGYQTLTSEESTKLKGEDPDHATRDLFEAIAHGDYPKWRVCVQVMTDEQASKHPHNPFDIKSG